MELQMAIYANAAEYTASRNSMVRRYAPGRAKYPWKQTAVGKSFFVPDMLSCITHTTARDVVYRDFKLFKGYTMGMKAVPGSCWAISNQYDDEGKPLGVLVTRVA
jgi:hypothetical protein